MARFFFCNGTTTDCLRLDYFDLIPNVIEHVYMHTYMKMDLDSNQLVLLCCHVVLIALAALTWGAHDLQHSLNDAVIGSLDWPGTC